jgi:hypothetical protein
VSHASCAGYRTFLHEAADVTEAQRDQVKALIAQMDEPLRASRAGEPPAGTAAARVDPPSL